MNDLILRFKLRYLNNKLNKLAAKKYRVVEIAENVFRLQVYDNLSLAEYIEASYGPTKYKYDWQWHDMYADSGLTYDELVEQCHKCRLKYKMEIVKKWIKEKESKNYPKVVY